jgi:hypothetical protein
MSRRKRFQLSIVNYWSSCSKSYLADWVDAIEGWVCIVLNALDVLELCLIEFFRLRDLMNGLVCLCSDIALDFSPKPMGVCFSRSSREIFFALSLGPKVQSASFLFFATFVSFYCSQFIMEFTSSRCRHVSYCRSTLLWSLEICCLCVTYYRKASLSAQILQAMQGGLLYFGFKSLFPQESSKCKCNPCFFLFGCETCVCELNSLLILSYIVMR